MSNSEQIWHKLRIIEALWWQNYSFCQLLSGHTSKKSKKFKKDFPKEEPEEARGLSCCCWGRRRSFINIRGRNFYIRACRASSCFACWVWARRREGGREGLQTLSWNPECRSARIDESQPASSHGPSPRPAAPPPPAVGLGAGLHGARRRQEEQGGEKEQTFTYLHDEISHFAWYMWPCIYAMWNGLYLVLIALKVWFGQCNVEITRLIWLNYNYASTILVQQVWKSFRDEGFLPFVCSEILSNFKGIRSIFRCRPVQFPSQPALFTVWLFISKIMQLPESLWMCNF